jgi:D-serine deaminase-like pyridoxal phosphate-dependent protein
MQQILLVLSITAATVGSARDRDDRKAEPSWEFVEFRNGVIVIEDSMTFKIAASGRDDGSYYVEAEVVNAGSGPSHQVSTTIGFATSWRAYDQSR